MKFISPFDSLGNKQGTEDVQWEEVDGAFSCQERGCWNVCSIAKYAEEKKVITWRCQAGHDSRIEDYIL